MFRKKRIEFWKFVERIVVEFCSKRRRAIYLKTHREMWKR